MTGSSGVESDSACPLSPLTTDALPLATTVSTSETPVKPIDLLCKSLLATGDNAFSVLQGSRGRGFGCHIWILPFPDPPGLDDTSVIQAILFLLTGQLLLLKGLEAADVS
jgi:hypothetical protein